MRPLHILLQLVLKEFTTLESIGMFVFIYKKYKSYPGLCMVITALEKASVITEKEADKLLKVIKTKLKSTNDRYLVQYTLDDKIKFIVDPQGPFIWKPYVKSHRIKWLKEMITKYKPNEKV